MSEAGILHTSHAESISITNRIVNDSFLSIAEILEVEMTKSPIIKLTLALRTRNEGVRSVSGLGKPKSKPL